MTDFLRAGDPLTRLDADRRARDVAALRRTGTVDVLVIGGGITGAGVALDAASRGMTVALVERNDLAHGTSRWSSKLIHGGLRYLVKGDIGIAWESAVERSAIGERIAPHLVRPITQLVPEYEADSLDARAARVAFLGGDLLRLGTRTKRGLLPHAHTISAEEALEAAPALEPDGLRGAAVGYDLQLEDDARMVLAVARTAAAYGARVLTRMAAISVDGHLVSLHDELTGDDLTVRAQWVINATGVWAGELDRTISLAPSRGTHVVVRSASLGDSPVSLAVGVPEHFGRLVFTLPQPDGLTYIGLTDEPAEGPLPDVPQAPDADVEWILGIISRHLSRPLTMADVVGRFAGLRPLLDGQGKDSADLSRRHNLSENGAMITITGGKFTTYRAMAQQVVDRISDRPCRTADLPLIGAGPVTEAEGVPERLVRRYGSEAPLVWSLALADPALAEPIAEGVPTLGVELVFGMLWEGAASTEDLLDRRTRIGLVPDDAAAALPAAERIAAQYGPAAAVSKAASRA